MWRYVLPVLVASLLLNIPTFFESYVFRAEDGKFSLRISSLRMNPLYSSITKWTRLFLLGLIPFAIIIYFNIKVYYKLRERTVKRGNTENNKSCRKAINGHKIEVNWMALLYKKQYFLLEDDCQTLMSMWVDERRKAKLYICLNE